MTNNCFQIGTFLNQSDIELKRAERYRVFVSLTRFDLTFVHEMFGERSGEIIDTVLEHARKHIRASDIISRVDSSIALLFPETPRQGAEVSARRLCELMRTKLSELSQDHFDRTIPLEIASYPDTAGARTLQEFLTDLADRRRN